MQGIPWNEWPHSYNFYYSLNCSIFFLLIYCDLQFFIYGKKYSFYYPWFLAFTGPLRTYSSLIRKELLYFLLANIKIPGQSYLWWKRLAQGMQAASSAVWVLLIYCLIITPRKDFLKEFFNMFTYIYTMLEMTVDIFTVTIHYQRKA